jgi:hypothetical protein
MAPIGRWVKTTDIEYPFEHGVVIKYTSDGVSIHPVTTTIQAPFLTQWPERKETAQGLTIKQIQNLMAAIGND